MAIHKFVPMCKRGVSRTASSKWIVVGSLRPLVLRVKTPSCQHFLARWLAHYRFIPTTSYGPDAEPPSLHACR